MVPPSVQRTRALHSQTLRCVYPCVRVYETMRVRVCVSDTCRRTGRLLYVVSGGSAICIPRLRGTIVLRVE